MKVCKQRFLLLISLLVTLPAQSETLLQYIDHCKTQLGFTSIPAVQCDDGVLFAPSSTGNFGTDPTNDFVGYRRIGETLDMVFACRWHQDSTSAFSIEMLLHDRQSGKTCFFRAKEGTIPNGNPNVASADLVSITDSNTSNITNYWRTPAEVDSSARCVNCHVSGPYIASPRIAPFLQRYGLLNNGHDNFSSRYTAIAPANGVFSSWNAAKQSFNVAEPCAAKCHSIGSNSTQVSLSFFAFILIPSISQVIADTSASGVMPADAASETYSDYRWINMDTPTNDGTEYETLMALKQQYPQFYCSNPTAIEAHSVGSTHVVDNFAYIWRNKLRTFNARDGLLCVNSDQGSGQACHDYAVRYQCNGAWTGNETWYDWDHNPANDEHEEKSHHSGVCASPTAIQARFYAPAGSGASIPVFVNGPKDRLSQFDSNGLVCKDSDQGAGKKCDNYVVRYSCNSVTAVAAPTQITQYQSSGNIGTAEKTFVVTGIINGWQASNTNGRQIIVNGVPVSSGQSLPPKTMDGKYYFTFTAGGVSYASWNYW